MTFPIVSPQKWVLLLRAFTHMHDTLIKDLFDQDVVICRRARRARSPLLRGVRGQHARKEAAAAPS